MIDNKSIRKVIMLNKILKGGSPTYEDREASGAVANFTTNTVQPFVSVDCEILPKQEGTGDPSPSNPRPISGTSVLNVTRTGLNIFDKKPFSDWVTKSPYMVLDDNLPKNSLLTMVFIDKDTSIDISGCYLGFVKDTYNGGTVQNEDYHWTLQNGVVRGRTDNVAEIGTDLCNYLMMYPTDEATYNKIFSRFDIMVVVGASTATDFEPYNAETYTFDLGQEIMSGTADVVGGVGSKTYAKIVLDGTTDPTRVNWRPQTNTIGWLYDYSLTSNKIVTSSVLPNLLADTQLTKTYSDLFNNDVVGVGVYTSSDYGLVVRVADTSLTTKEAINTYLSNNPITIVFELATPTEYTFTGQPINSFEGVNNVWTDSGDIEVTYKYKTGEGGSSKKKYLPIFYDMYGKDCRHL